MATANHIITDSLLYIVDRAVQTSLSTSSPPATSATSSLTTTTVSSSPAATSSTSGGGVGGGSSPLLFFVALGFGVVFTNLWIIVGVKYCFRYNARNRALRNGEGVDPITLDNMPARPHRRRREKKLMTMDEVNERFPLLKYKNWVATRASEGLPTTGGVAATSRPPSVREADGALAPSAVDTEDAKTSPPPTGTAEDVRRTTAEQKAAEVDAPEEETGPLAADHYGLKEVNTSDTTSNQHASGEDEDDDDDEHIPMALAPELLANPGDSCAICIDTLEPDDDVRGLTCGHAFHAGCLDPWLTSRRACCPLCKADYYVPKPRAEGEQPEADRSGRRGRMPAPPAATWTSMRNNRMLPSRFTPAGYVGDGVTYGVGASRREIRARQAAIVPALGLAEPAVVQAEPAPSRWRPRISNPFKGLRVPGRTRTTDAAAEGSSEPSPSQLEAGVTR